MTGVTGFVGQLLLKRMDQQKVSSKIFCLTRKSIAPNRFQEFNLSLEGIVGDCSKKNTWSKFLEIVHPDIIIHIASIRHVPYILESLSGINKQPRLIVIGTTGVYSKYNQYSVEYRLIENQLRGYLKSYCLLRPTMIYGSHLDKNLHKLICFCDRYRFFPIFGSGQNLLQPVHADDLAQAILSVFFEPNIEGAYDLSGGSVVTFNELIKLVEKLLGKPVCTLRLPYHFGLCSATLLEKALGKRSPISHEQILRLQEDKAYSHAPAARYFGYAPRSLEVGLAQEIRILRSQGLI
ncbi:MAG: NAD-dependent epimerase/dehydratase family protein [Cyanobacteria bacterium P01_G01_bin.54]